MTTTTMTSVDSILRIMDNQPPPLISYTCDVCKKDCKTEAKLLNHGSPLCKRLNMLAHTVYNIPEFITSISKFHEDSYEQKKKELQKQEEDIKKKDENMKKKEETIKKKEEFIKNKKEDMKKKEENIKKQKTEIANLKQIIRQFKMAQVYMNITPQETV